MKRLIIALAVTTLLLSCSEKRELEQCCKDIIKEATSSMETCVAQTHDRPTCASLGSTMIMHHLHSHYPKMR